MTTIPLPTLTLTYQRRTTDVPLLTKAYGNPVGYDIFAHLMTETGRTSQIVLPAHAARVIPTGITLRPPPGYFVAICSRSGLASKGVFVANAPGIIDPDYTGELGVVLFNGTPQSLLIKHHDALAQLVLFPHTETALVETNELPPLDTIRGARGFGSSETRT